MSMASFELPFVECNKSRHGTMRYYLRMDGQRLCRLPNSYGSEEFLSEYWSARKAYESKKAPAPVDVPLPLAAMTTRPASFKWLTLQYMASSAFKQLDTTTQGKRRSIIESMWAEPIKPDDSRLFADIPFAKMTVAHLEILRDRKKETPFAADERLKVLRQVFATTDRDGKPITDNIALIVKAYRRATDGHSTASPDDLAQYIRHHGVKSKAVLALAILMFTGIRISDLSRIGPQHRRRDAFQLRLFKNRNRKPVTLTIPIHPILDAVLKMHPVTGLTYLVTDWGKPFSTKGLGNRVSDWFSQAGLKHLTAHSVRKGLATDQAHNGASDNMLEAMFGWSDPKTSKIYTRNAEQARLAMSAVSQIKWDGIAEEFFATTDGDAAHDNTRR